ERGECSNSEFFNDIVRERTFEIRFLDPGVEAFVFTFG
ncbi:hypothetical protein, partial [Sinorhizobium fredii]